MSEISTIMDILKFLGLTPDRLVPLAFLTLALYIVFNKKLYKHLNPIKLAIVEIQTKFGDFGHSIKYSLTETRESPIKPSDYGLQLAEESKLKEIIIQNKEKFLKELDYKLKENLPITAYDVQEKSRQLMLDYKDNNLMNPVKLYAFKQGIEVEVILRVGGSHL